MAADGSLVSWALDNSLTSRLWTQEHGIIEFNFHFSPIGEGGLSDEAISDDGSVVVGSAAFGGPGAPKGIGRWTYEGGFETLGVPPGSSIAPAPPVVVSGDGSIIFGKDAHGSLFRWSADEGMTSLGAVTGANDLQLNGVSADGSVVSGIASTLNVGSLWRWTKGTGLVVLETGTPEKSFRDHSDISGLGQWLSADGSVIVGVRRAINGSNAEVYRWTEATGLEILPNFAGYPNMALRDMTPDGKWLFGQSWITYDGSVESAGKFVPWLWSEETGLRNLLEVFEDQGLSPSINGWKSLWDAAANWGRISADGRAIIGSGVNPDGYVEAWVAYLDPLAVPEPTAAALALLALTGMVAGWRLDQQCCRHKSP
jgi:hypothetical protein